MIVSWNAKSYLRDCLLSINKNSCEYLLEVIVVDNASVDGSPEMVAEQFPSVRLIRNSCNEGFAKANNRAIKACTGEYICLINSDVKVLDHCITRLVNFLGSQSSVGMAGPRIIGRDGKLQRSCRGFPTVWNMLCRSLALDTLFPNIRFFCGYSLSHWAHDTQAEVQILSGCFWIVRRSALQEVGLLDAGFFMYGEDMDWCRRFWKEKWKVVFYPESEAIHYGGASSANAPVRFYIEQQRADLSYWRKHHSLVAVVCYFLISCVHLSLRFVGYTVASSLSRKCRATYLKKMRRSLAALSWLFFRRMPASG